MPAKKIDYALFGLLAIVLGLLIYLMASDSQIVSPKAIPKDAISIAGQKIIPEEKTIAENVTPKKPAISDDGEPNLLISSSQKVGELPNYVSDQDSCPPMISIKYLVDHKGTMDTTDDDVYINLKNSKEIPEYVSIEVDDTPEGSLGIVGLGSSEIKSNIITTWWKSRTISETKAFGILIIPNYCAPVSSELFVSYPLSEEAYLD